MTSEPQAPSVGEDWRIAFRGYDYGVDLERQAKAMLAALGAPAPSPNAADVVERDLDRELLAVQIAKLENWAAEMDRSAKAMREMRLDDAARGNAALAADLRAGVRSLIALITARDATLALTPTPKEQP